MSRGLRLVDAADDGLDTVDGNDDVEAVAIVSIDGNDGAVCFSSSAEGMQEIVHEGFVSGKDSEERCGYNGIRLSHQ